MEVCEISSWASIVVRLVKFVLKEFTFLSPPFSVGFFHLAGKELKYNFPSS